MYLPNSAVTVIQAELFEECPLVLIRTKGKIDYSKHEVDVICQFVSNFTLILSKSYFVTCCLSFSEHL